MNFSGPIHSVNRVFLLGLSLAFAGLAFSGPQIRGAEYEEKPDDPYFRKFNPRKAPAYSDLLLRKGDRLAIIGDSITEQKIYSRIIETYLAACRPDLAVEVRQLGWSGETVERFRKRAQADCFRFSPTIATLCYGMNDSKYRPYDEINGQWFRENLSGLVGEMKSRGLRVVVGSPGIAEKYAVWVATRSGTLDEHNLHLCALRDIALDIAEREQVRFADVFWPMLKAGFTARARYGGDSGHPYNLIGRDGIHPDRAGHLIMAYAFLRSLGLNGEIGTITVDLSESAPAAIASVGHEVKRFDGKEIVILSTRFPFCASGPADRDDSIRSGMTLVPFAQELNRFTLVAKGKPKTLYLVRWGTETRIYSAAALEQGVNLAEDFPLNPFTGAFEKIDTAVGTKQAFETHQIKALMHGAEGKQDQEGTVASSEVERARLIAEIHEAQRAVEHTLVIEPL